MNDKTFKIIVIILLASIVVIVGVTSYLFLNTYSNNTEGDIEVELANNSTSNNTVEVTPEEVTQPKYIGKDQAISIVINTVPTGGKIRYTATLITSTSRPYYRIDVYGDDPNSDSYGQLIGWAHVDAITGEFLGGMG